MVEILLAEQYYINLVKYKMLSTDRKGKNRNPIIQGSQSPHRSSYEFFPDPIFAFNLLGKQTTAKTLCLCVFFKVKLITQHFPLFLLKAQVI